MTSIQELPNRLSLHPHLFKDERLLAEAQYHFSQHGEDVVVSTYLKYVKPRPEKGVVVDFGAYHPYRFSNTFLLYLQGWRGLNVDGNLEAIKQFEIIRPEDRNIHALISDVEEELEFFQFPEGAYNTTLKSSADFLQERGKQDPATGTMRIERMITTTPNKLLERHIGSHPIDFLNIDLEGMDERVLSCLDYERFRPRVICAELDPSDFARDPLNKFLRQAKYKIFSNCVKSTLLIDALEA